MATTTTTTRAETTLLFVGSRRSPTRPVTVRAYTLNPRTGTLDVVDIPRHLSGQVKTFFSHLDGIVPPLVVISPPPPKGPVGDDFIERVAAELRANLR